MYSFRRLRAFHVLLLLYIGMVPMSAAAGENVSVTIPGSVISELIAATVPVQVPIKEKGFSGNIWIESVDDLGFGDNEVTFSAHIRGEDIRYRKMVRDRPLDLSFGNVEMVLKCRGLLRYDSNENTLYVTPYAKEEIDTDKSSGLLMGISPLIAILSGVEYPVKIQKLDPIILQRGDKKLQVALMIADIRTQDERLFIDLKPSVSSCK